VDGKMGLKELPSILLPQGFTRLRHETSKGQPTIVEWAEMQQ